MLSVSVKEFLSILYFPTKPNTYEIFNIETVDPMNDPQLEYLEDSPFPNPLENLRMDPMTLSMLANLRAATAKYQKFDIAIDDGSGNHEGLYFENIEEKFDKTLITKI